MIKNKKTATLKKYNGFIVLVDPPDGLEPTKTNQFKVSVPYGTGFIDTTYPLLKRVHKYEKLMEGLVIS